MLYHKVPRRPLSFRSDTKAKEYFEKAVETDSNLDTHYRYGEFLLDTGEKEEGLLQIKKALAFPNRAGREEDKLKKEEIQALIKAQED